MLSLDKIRLAGTKVNTAICFATVTVIKTSSRLAQLGSSIFYLIDTKREKLVGAMSGL